MMRSRGSLDRRRVDMMPPGGIHDSTDAAARRLERPRPCVGARWRGEAAGGGRDRCVGPHRRVDQQRGRHRVRTDRRGLARGPPARDRDQPVRGHPRGPGGGADLPRAAAGHARRRGIGAEQGGQPLARATRNAVELERYNPNYVGGDINGGLADLRQLLLRPVARLDPYATPAPDVFLCSSSTPPGGGVHGMCGYWCARSVLARALG